MAEGFSSKQARQIVGITDRQLGYWRRTELVCPSERTDGGHARYTFQDLIALTTAKRLIDAGVSVQRIRKNIAALTALLPTLDRPLSEVSLMATGDVVLVFHGGMAFEALSGQEWIFPVAELQRQVEAVRGDAPEQGELFAGWDMQQQADTTDRDGDDPLAVAS